MSVVPWLRQLGLERYEQAFAAQDIDAQTLPLLTEADLVEIGIKSVGHRRKIIEAIAALKQSVAPPAATPSAPVVRLDAEHRQICVLSCDLVGSTALSERLDPEELREVIRAFHEAGTRVVARYDGHVANFIGDCVLAYFGWPRAHEDDAERAVRAALALVDAVAGVHVPSGGALAVRVSIASGSVVVGDFLHDGPAQDQSAVGAAPMVTAQLQALAPPGQVVIDELSARLLGSSFVLHPLGRHMLQGIAEPVTAYAVTGEKPADSRFDARQGQALAPMVGREQELSLLLERWSQARGGEGQAVLLVGEAGIGKSRLTRALLDACSAQPHWTVRWQCSPYHTGSPLWPVAQGLSRAAGLAPDEPNDQALDKLEAVTGRNITGHDDKEATALYATLLGLNGSQRYGPLEMTPQMLRERTLELVIEQLLEMARQRSVLLVIEDAHWIDPSTLELIERCLERIDGAPMLILITSRPDHQPALGAHPSVTRLSLNRLNRASVQAIVARLGGAGLNPHTLATIVAQTDGVPLFVEELTKAVLETGEAAIPASLHGSLMARLDRVPEVKEVAQIAACIGREFDEALMRAVAEHPDAAVAAIEQLAAAELIFRRGERANPRYTFKHALVQEAAYESLLRTKRQRLHARILEVLEGTRHDTPPEILAHHADRALQIDKAIAHWSQAGQRALAKSAYVEAIRFLESAIAQIQTRADSAERRMRESELQLRLGQARIAAEGYGTDATRDAFMRAEALFEPAPGRASHGLQVQYGLWAWYTSRADLKQSVRIADRAQAAAQADGGAAAQLYALRMVSASHLYRGELGRARACFEQAVTLLDAKRGELRAQFGPDPELMLLHYFAWVLGLQGLADQSRQWIARAGTVEAAAATSLNTRALLHLFRFLRAACLRDRAALKREADVFAELAFGHRLYLFHGYADVLQGWTALDAGVSVDEAVESHERALGRVARTGSRLYVPFLMASFAAELAGRGRYDDARRTIERAFGLHEFEDWCMAELWRVRGETLLGGGPGDSAQAARCFVRALDIARAQGAKLWELRAAVSLARLRAREGQRAAALDVLAPVYDGFSEGFDTVDLLDARALLAEWGSQHQPVPGAGGG
ncbi:MAG TPA: AAA family ATPase [Burkholderiaceae bacterium]